MWKQYNDDYQIIRFNFQLLKTVEYVKIGKFPLYIRINIEQKSLNTGVSIFIQNTWVPLMQNKSYYIKIGKMLIYILPIYRQHETHFECVKIVWWLI